MRLARKEHPNDEVRVFIFTLGRGDKLAAKRQVQQPTVCAGNGRRNAEFSYLQGVTSPTFKNALSYRRAVQNATAAATAVAAAAAASMRLQESCIAAISMHGILRWSFSYLQQMCVGESHMQTAVQR